MKKKILILSIDEISEQREKDFYYEKLKETFFIEYICFKDFFCEKISLKSLKMLYKIIKRHQKIKPLVISDIKFNNNKTKILLYYIFLKKLSTDRFFVDKGQIIDHIRYKSNLKHNIKRILTILMYNKNFSQINYEQNFLNYRSIRINNIKYTSDCEDRKKDFILFLDSCFLDHPDFKIFIKEKKFLKRDIYINNLNNLFSLLEEKYNKKIIIAAHPKSNYNTSTFNNRKIIKGETIELIKNAALVLCHSSTSIFNAIEYNKPICLLYSKDMLDTNVKQWIKATIEYSRLLNAPLIEIDNIDLEKITFDFDIVAYKKFQNNFIFDEKIKDKKNSEIIMESLKNV